MFNTVTLKVDGVSTEMAWSEFVGNIQSTNASARVQELFDTAFILQCSTLLFLMQAGFIMREAGGLSTKQRLGTLILQKLTAVLLCAAFYFTIGYGMCYGDGSPWVGFSGYGGTGPPLCSDGDKSCNSKELALMFFRFLKMATAATIVTGSVAERVRLLPFVLMTSVTCTVILPLITRTAYTGWASPYSPAFSSGVLDYGDVGAVHVAGAIPALIMLPLIGPRPHRFAKAGKNVVVPGQDPYLPTIGTFLIWAGWYGQVLGGMPTIEGGVLAKVACNTTISAVAACFASFLLGLKYNRRMESMDAINGTLSGLVGITGACATVETEWALVIGIVSALIYFSVSKTFIKLHWDDVVDAVPKHLCCGIWALIAPALFSKRDLVKAAYPNHTQETDIPCGVFYKCNGLGTTLLGTNLLYCFSILLWVGTLSALVILPLWYFDLLQNRDIYIEEHESDNEEISEQDAISDDTAFNAKVIESSSQDAEYLPETVLKYAVSMSTPEHGVGILNKESIHDDIITTTTH